jgi:opacity protein-like surface antigen
VLAFAVPAGAQPGAAAAPAPSVSIRPFLMGMQQSFAAKDTFDAVFEKSAFPFWGGGADITFGSYFVELNASRFNQTGERVFRFNGENFPLGIPLTAKITPFELLGGYRFLRWRHVIPYGGVGVGSYKYEEESEFNEPEENVEERRSGLALVGGAEIRLHRWVGIGADVHYSRVKGILGPDGVNSSVSTDVGEDDLGGVAARFKIMIGR